MISRQRQWQLRHPEKSYAQQAVSRALKTGLLVKQVCEECGGSSSQAHHKDYARPLDVTWLCSTCHSRMHVENRIPNNNPGRRLCAWVDAETKQAIQSLATETGQTKSKVTAGILAYLFGAKENPAA